MAVRAFDNTDPRPTLTLVEPAPLSRRDARGLRRRSATIALLALGTPFVVALLVLAVGH